MTPSPRLAGRVALITGASRGLGAAIARRYAAEGAHVVLMARTQGALEEVDDQIRAAGGTATLLPFDLRHADELEKVGPALYQRFGRLDILVGAAAMLGGLSPVGHYTIKDWNNVMAVNVTANWRLIRTFDLLLRQSDAGRAIFVTCDMARSATPYWGAYAASKAALEQMALTWAAEVGRTTALRVNLVDPGIMATRLRAEAFPGEEASQHPSPDLLTDPFVTLASPDHQGNGEILRRAEG